MSSSKNSELFSCKKIVKTYHDGAHETKVLNEIDFSMPHCQMLAIVGSSGSGKSTLLHILGGLDTVTSGQILFDGEDISAFSNDKRANLRNKHIGFIYQFHHLLPDFSAIENIAMPLLISGVSPTIAQEKAKKLLDQVGLSHRIKHRPSELSGGERQRIAIARALINDPLVVLADEPTGNLDRTNADEILKLIKHINEERKTAFLIVTHDLELAEKMERQLEMRDGVLTKEASLLKKFSTKDPF
ncbi:lipoprotein-releasing ABC transporter ATP-binding protein LolD [Thorsellia kenyensis]|uniref:Lipoprotein-releasing system ATP-binding protein LolD n=1 Tax=Thorsellia kenyensis TaxID=1549888 RepID=A0ABV6CEA7_9GAMM